MQFLIPILWFRLSVTPDSGDPIPSSGFHVYCPHMVPDLYVGKTSHTRKIKNKGKNLKDVISFNSYYHLRQRIIIINLLNPEILFLFY